MIRWVVVVLILGLSGSVIWLTSRLNAHTYRLTVTDGKLVILKGRPFPVGSLPFRPQDTSLADAYAPLLLPGPAPADLLERSFSERDELDRALFGVLEDLAKPRIASGQPQDVEQGLYYLGRAQKLAGLSPDQRTALNGLLADVAFYRARGRLEDAQRTLGEASEQLRLAVTRSGPKASTAKETAARLETAVKALEDALHAAGSSTQSAPAPDAGTSTTATEDPQGGAVPLDRGP